MADQAPVIIIRRKKKGGHEGHHGGAWKVAYADFVTAMMAFFLLLWLLNVTTDVERKGIADYFAPASISKSESGAGGVMGGQTITASGAQISYATPPTAQDVTVPTVGRGDEGDEDSREKSKSEDTPSTSAHLSKEERAMVDAMKREENTFKQAEDLMKKALATNSVLQAYANQITVDRTPEGLRIQIIDRDRFSMFPSGASVPYEKGRDLLLLIGQVIAKLPNMIAVTGHTDGTPFSAGSRRDNWTLSTERANTSRQYLIQAGVDERRIARVAGLSDRDPFVPDPKDPRNRRISIVLLRQSLASMPATSSMETTDETRSSVPSSSGARQQREDTSATDDQLIAP